MAGNGGVRVFSDVTILILLMLDQAQERITYRPAEGSELVGTDDKAIWVYYFTSFFLPRIILRGLSSDIITFRKLWFFVQCTSPISLCLSRRSYV